MQARPQSVGKNGDVVERMIHWVEEHRDWINRQQKAQIVFHVAGKDLQVEIGLGKEKI